MPSKTAGNAAANVFRRQGFGPIGADAGHCPSLNDLRPICGLANGVSGPSAVKVRLRFGDASSVGVEWCYPRARTPRTPAKPATEGV